MFSRIAPAWALSLLLLLATCALTRAQSPQNGNITLDSVNPALQSPRSPQQSPTRHPNVTRRYYPARIRSRRPYLIARHPYRAPQAAALLRSLASQKSPGQAQGKGSVHAKVSSLPAKVAHESEKSKAEAQAGVGILNLPTEKPQTQTIQPDASVTTPAPPENAVSAPVTTGSEPSASTDKTASAKTETLTRPDLIPAPDPTAGSAPSPVHTQDNPFAAVGDSGKMLLYLVPILLLTWGALRLLRRAYARNGKLPGSLASHSRGDYALSPSAKPARGLLGALMGGFHLNNARQRGGGSIRLVESVPVGSANLHLIEVRGRVLLVGATNAGVSLLTEFEQETLAAGDFHALLHAAAADMDALNLDSPDIPATAMVSTLEDAMRETSDAVRRGARRLRTVQEVEDEYD